MNKCIIDEKLLEELEKMSKLHFGNEERKKMIKDLNNIINTFEVLEKNVN